MRCQPRHRAARCQQDLPLWLTASQAAETCSTQGVNDRTNTGSRLSSTQHSPLQILLSFRFIATLGRESGIITISIVKTRKLISEKGSAQGHRAGVWQSQDSNPGQGQNSRLMLPLFYRPDFPI